MKPIGGYFELAERGAGTFPHPDGLLLNTGRNAFEHILGGIPDVRELLVPYFTCEAVLEPVRKLGIQCRRYAIDNRLELSDEIRLFPGQYLVANNYFGIQDAYIERLAQEYADRLIVDNAQAFFAPPIPGIKSFYSPRKYVGVCDGGIAYSWKSSDAALSYEYDDSSARRDHLFLRKEKGAEAGYGAFLQAEKSLENQPVRRMSLFTEEILRHIDYEGIRERRRENYAFLHRHLGDLNALDLPPMNSFTCPMVYPCLLPNGAELREKLIENKVFVARYWPDVVPFGNLLAIPCDQRMDQEDLLFILNLLHAK